MIKMFDAHFHIIDPQFPLIPNQGYVPDAYTTGDYLARIKAPLTLTGGAIVSGSFQGFDQSYLVHSLQQLGNSFVGVTQLPASTDDHTIMELHDAGVRAVRFNLYRGGSETIDALAAMAHRVYELAGWHIELYVDSVQLEALYPLLVTLPKVSIDHLGLSKAGLPWLYKAAEHGIGIKATGFGRVDFAVPEVLKAIDNINPTALMFGTDLPSTRAPRPYEDADVDQVIEALGEPRAQAALCDNALAFYGVAI